MRSTVLPGGTHEWRHARNILCVRLDTLGDVLMTAPAIRALKTSSPGRRITLLTSPSGAEAGRLLSEVDEILVYQAPWMKTERPSHGAEDLRFLESLRIRAFDAAAVFTVYSQNPLPAALLCYQAGIPLRLAYCRENPYHLLTQWIREPEPQTFVRHEVQRQLDLVATVGAHTAERRLSVSIPAAAFDAVDSLLKDRIDQVRPWIVIHPGASAASRRYPPESFATAASRLASDYGFQILFTGTMSERALIHSVQTRMGVSSVSLAGALSLGELAALLWNAPLLISNNTGTVHVAAAAGTPVVDLYALTNPQHTPWMVPCRVLFHDVPCKFCYKSACPEGHQHCLSLVTPETVVQAALDLWETHRQRYTRRELPRVYPWHQRRVSRSVRVLGPARDGAGRR
jgi:lipopolysaccharide heptosyltransferase II